MNKKTILLIQCPKCLKRLKVKEELWLSYPYCFNCNTQYDVCIRYNDMSIEITEKVENENESLKLNNIDIQCIGLVDGTCKYGYKSMCGICNEYNPGKPLDVKSASESLGQVLEKIKKEF